MHIDQVLDVIVARPRQIYDLSRSDCADLVPLTRQDAASVEGASEGITHQRVQARSRRNNLLCRVFWQSYKDPSTNLKVVLFGKEVLIRGTRPLRVLVPRSTPDKPPFDRPQRSKVKEYSVK